MSGIKRAFVVGINGKMGRILAESAAEYGYTVVGGLDLVSDGNNVFDSVGKVNIQYDVVIDFSRACEQTLGATIALCSDADTPAVIATTGYSDEQLRRITELSKRVPIFRSANMSLGIAAVKAAATVAKSILGDSYDIEIVEKHHREKLDAPSGTALLLADALTDKSNQVINRSGKRKCGEVGITSVRGGNTVGEHEIGFYGDDEVVTVSHSALSRKLFAAGAFKAADFITGMPPAMYGMDDLVRSLLNLTHS